MKSKLCSVSRGERSRIVRLVMVHYTHYHCPTSVAPAPVDSPSFEPPSSMNLFHLPSSSSSPSAPPQLNNSLLLGTRPANTSNIAIESNNWDMEGCLSPEDIAQAKGYSGSYLAAIYDPETQEVTLHPAPLLTLARSIIPSGGQSARIQGGATFAAARRDLGEAFGNRKQKLAMRNADRMKVDTTGMDEGILQGVTEAIGESKFDVDALHASQGADGSQPTAANLASRPIPTPHLEATSPEDVYPLSELFPREISSNIYANPYMHASDVSGVQKLLPLASNKSNWLANRIWNRVLSSQRASGEAASSGASGILKTSASHQKQQLRLVLYIAYLWALRSLAASNRKILNDRKGLKEKLKLTSPSAEASSEALLDALLAAFCSRDRARKTWVLTPFGETKLLATLLALCLHADGFVLEIEVLAAEIGMSPNRLKEVAKSLGCTTRYRQGLDLEGGAQQQPAEAGAKGKAKKVMVLKCPVKLPDGSRGGPPARK